jgi:hypothetical protein
MTDCRLSSLAQRLLSVQAMTRFASSDTGGKASLRRAYINGDNPDNITGCSGDETCHSRNKRRSRSVQTESRSQFQVRLNRPATGVKRPIPFGRRMERVDLTYLGGGPTHSPPGTVESLVQVVNGMLTVARSPAALRLSHAASVAMAQDST